MKMFEGLDVTGVEKTEDRVGGNSRLFDSDIYTATIKTAYVGTSRSGAMNVTLIASIGDREYTETLYITNKEKVPYYIDQQRKKRFIPGYNIVNNICKVCTGKGLNELDTEEKVLNVYDFDQKKNVPTAVPVIVDLMGKEVALGILREIRNKVAQENGVYVDTPETREQNLIANVFYPDTHQTVNEKEENKDPTFYTKWLEKNQGKTIDRRTIKDPKANTASGSNTPKPRTSLFDK